MDKPLCAQSRQGGKVLLAKRVLYVTKKVCFKTIMDLFIEDDLWWSATLYLNSWAGYQSRHGPYTSIDKPEPSGGQVTLRFGPDGRGIEPLCAEEMAAIAWFGDNETRVSAAVKAAVMDWCVSFSVEVIDNEDGLKRNIGLYCVNIHNL
jgi:hypothetical protein